MCLAYPGKIIFIKSDKATVDFGGITKKINISLVRNVRVGDYVNVHAGFAIQKISGEGAMEIFKIYEKSKNK